MALRIKLQNINKFSLVSNRKPQSKTLTLPYFEDSLQTDTSIGLNELLSVKNVSHLFFSEPIPLIVSDELVSVQKFKPWILVTFKTDINIGF